MKKSIVIIMLMVMILPFLMAAIIKPTVGSELSTPYGRWKQTANLLSVGAEPSDLAADVRTYLTVLVAIEANVNGDGKIILGTLPYGVDALRFRLNGITEDAIIVTQVYTGARDGYPDCDLVKRGTLTFTIGTQGSIEATYELADTVVITNTNASTKFWVIASPGDNTCCEVFIDIQGDDTYCIVGTTVECDAHLNMKDF